ncbi:hypothetical protein HDU79_009116 [Rhizoclosmatium sp. JEL0117]|nr:hypothetical protein HDU79_009116 [Rhizoclosmatium sp. JEL0117]
MVEVSLVPITNASKEDADLLIKLRIECGWNAELVPEWIEEAKTHVRVLYFVRNVNGAVIGMVSLLLVHKVDLRYADISAKRTGLQHLYIQKQFEGKGYGSAAIREIERIAVEHFSSETMFLLGDKSNSRAFGLYQRLGYEEVVGMGEKEWEPWVVMRKSLILSSLVA